MIGFSRRIALTDAPIRKSHASRRTLLVGALIFAILALTQWARGAFNAEFTADPDEAAHYVTGLMVRDYIGAGFPQPPMRFAENYYIHYPKVAFGHWPPGFYIVQGIWTLCTSDSRTLVILLLVLIATVLTTTVWYALHDEVGWIVATLCAALVVTLPLVQGYTGVVMTDVPVTLLVFWGGLAYGRYLDVPSWQRGAIFGVLAAAAILTKGTALVLALIPVLALLFGRGDLLRRASFLTPAMLVVLLAAPWYLAGDPAIRSPFRGTGFSIEKSRQFLDACGVAALLYAAMGVYAQVLTPLRAGRVKGLWAAAGALLIAIWLFESVVADAEPFRNILLAVPPLVMFAGAGVAWTAGRLPDRLLPRRQIVLAAGLAAAVVAGERVLYPLPWPLRERPRMGFSEVAEHLLSLPELSNSVFLISADALGEGAFVAAVAMRDRRPGHIVLRGSKVLSESNWNGNHYRSAFATPEAMAAYLESIPVDAVVVNESWPNSPADHRLLRQVLKATPARWIPMPIATPQTSSLRVYRFAGQTQGVRGTIRIPMRYSLKRTISR